MPYSKPSEAPDYIAEDKRPQWIAVWNSAFKKAKADGKSDKEAESSASAQANSVTGTKSDKKANTMTTELRFTAESVRAFMRENGSADPFIIEGYAATYNTPATIEDFTEIIMPTAFLRAIAERQDVRCLRNHDPNYILGRSKSGTLEISSDDKGLKFRCSLPDSGMGHDTYASVQRGDMDGCSFAFRVVKQEWEETQSSDGVWMGLRKLLDLDLADVSMVTYPAYPGTSVVARNEDMPAEIRSSIAAKNAEKIAPIGPGDEKRDDNEPDEDDLYDWDLINAYPNGIPDDVLSEYNGAKDAAIAALQQAYAAADALKDNSKDAMKEAVDAAKNVAKAVYMSAKAVAQAQVKAKLETKSEVVVAETAVVEIVPPVVVQEVIPPAVPAITEAEWLSMLERFAKAGPI